MKLSPEQQAIVDFTTHDHSTNVAIKAYAGSAKTTTLTMVAKAKPKSKNIVAVAFAKPNALDFERVMPLNVTSGTLHSFGLRAIKHCHGKAKVSPNKTWKIADSFNLKITKVFPRLPSVLGFAKAQGLVPYETLGEEWVCSQPVIHDYLEDTDNNWRKIFDKLAVTSDFDDLEMMSICRKFLATSIKLALPGPDFDPLVDFDDMIYIPACFSNGEGLPKPSVLLVDEGQDLNVTQHACVGFMGEKAQTIIVGDPNQAIYAFRGADANSFDSLIDQFDCKVFELSHTFRSDRKIVEAACEYVPGMRGFPQEDGEVNVFDTWQPTDVRQGDAILCRNTMPLVGIFYKLIKHGLPAKIKGTEIGKGLISVLKSKIRGDNFHELSDSIDQWYMAEERKAQEKAQAHRIAMLLEQSSILQVILRRVVELRPDSFGYKQHMINQLEQMFTDDVPKICLATIHKAKGLEWDKVWFLDPWLIPSKWAKQPWELQQEANIKYVGITRAKHVLNYVNSKNIQEA